MRFLLMRLSAETTVPVELLLEDEDLVSLLADTKDYDQALNYVNENY